MLELLHPFYQPFLLNPPFCLTATCIQMAFRWVCLKTEGGQTSYFLLPGYFQVAKPLTWHIRQPCKRLLWSKKREEKKKLKGQTILFQQQPNAGVSFHSRFRLP